MISFTKEIWALNDLFLPFSQFQCDFVRKMSKSLNISPNWESPEQFENQIKPLVYVRRITSSTMNEKVPIC